MPAITSVDVTASTLLNIIPAEVTLTGGGTDTFVFDPTRVQIMILRNPTGATITPRIIGSLAPAAEVVDGIGSFNFSVGTQPYPSGIPAGGVIAFYLNRYWRYLRGDCSISASTGTGLVASLLTF